jgi:Xaa-Pro aminopeptidase
LFNLRGSDVTFNPVVKAYAVVFSGTPAEEVPRCAKKQKVSSSASSPPLGAQQQRQDNVFLFMEGTKVTDEVAKHLLSGNATGNSTNIALKPYSDITTFLSQYLAEVGKVKVLLDGNSLNWGVYGAVRRAGAEVLDCPSVVAVSKSIKNTVEMQGIRDCHVRDGVALTAFLSWLDAHMASTAGAQDTCQLCEHEAAVKLETFRAAMPLYVSPSFDTISSYGSNGAVIHYHPPPEGSALLGHSSLFLLDSGGQYLDGTTDVTRTLYFGPHHFPEGSAAAAKLEEMRFAFTYVLKAHIALATAKFPEDTMGYRLVSSAWCIHLLGMSVRFSVEFQCCHLLWIGN